MVTPTLNKMRALAEEFDESSLRALEADCSRRERGKRKGAPGTGGQRAARAQGRAGGGR